MGVALFSLPLSQNVRGQGSWSGVLICLCRKDQLSLNPWLCNRARLRGWRISGHWPLCHLCPARVGGRKARLGLVLSEAALCLSLSSAGKTSCGERGHPWLLVSSLSSTGFGERLSVWTQCSSVKWGQSWPA